MTVDAVHLNVGMLTEQSPESTHVVVVEVGDEPGGDVPAQPLEVLVQVGGLGGEAAVHHEEGVPALQNEGGVDGVGYGFQKMKLGHNDLL